MKKLKLVYYYTYYTLYKAAQKSPTLFSYSFISILSFDAILLVLLSSFMFYYTGLTKIIINLNDNVFLLIVSILILVPNYFIFDYKDRYKLYVDKFDQLSEEENSKYKMVTWIGIILVIINFIYSVFYADLQAKKNHVGRYSIEYLEYEKQQMKEDSISRSHRSY